MNIDEAVQDAALLRRNDKCITGKRKAPAPNGEGSMSTSELGHCHYRRAAKQKHGRRKTRFYEEYEREGSTMSQGEARSGERNHGNPNRYAHLISEADHPKEFSSEEEWAWIVRGMDDIVSSGRKENGREVVPATIQNLLRLKQRQWVERRVSNECGLRIDVLDEWIRELEYVHNAREYSLEKKKNMIRGERAINIKSCTKLQGIIEEREREILAVAAELHRAVDRKGAHFCVYDANTR